MFVPRFVSKLPSCRFAVRHNRLAVAQFPGIAPTASAALLPRQRFRSGRRLFPDGESSAIASDHA
jgi:hypothetical protein